ncbi:hypothetical protein BD410DRAFT_286145 [Rickenella mellea]|uniref:Uncharacterized protein n=1 Tax=Rickenella mellea TaxID=50990 RepID=A0A4Y7Q2S3_9AGAM|nr:hypothetical protein BD410DRAFT_286145 [Rickenella mellea]
MLAKVKPLIPARIRCRIFGHINELPVELLAEIFLFCLPTCTFTTTSRHVAPILFGRVCRVWRSVSLNTPQLWAKVTLGRGKWYYSTDPPLGWITEFESTGIHEWLRRSGNFPLSFEIVAHTDPGTHHTDKGLGTRALRAQAHRWKVVSLRGNCKCIDRILKVLCTAGKTPRLTDIRFLNMRTFESDKPIPCAPQIRSLHLTLKDNPFLIDGRFHALRDLRIGWCSSQLYPLIFMQFPLLEILEITYSACSPPFGTATVVHTLPHLHTFIFADHPPSIHFWLLDLFDTPALNSLAISIWKVGGRFCERTRISNFLIRCGSQLQRLKLGGYSVSHDDINDFIQHTPILKSLCIEHATLTGDVTTLCSPLVQINILITRSGLRGTLELVDDIISQWKNCGLKTLASITSSYSIRVPYYHLPKVLRQKKVKKYIQQGFRICYEEESWWDTHVD